MPIKVLFICHGNILVSRLKWLIYACERIYERKKHLAYTFKMDRLMKEERLLSKTMSATQESF